MLETLIGHLKSVSVVDSYYWFHVDYLNNMGIESHDWTIRHIIMRCDI